MIEKETGLPYKEVTVRVPYSQWEDFEKYSTEQMQTVDTFVTSALSEFIMQRKCFEALDSSMYDLGAFYNSSHYRSHSYANEMDRSRLIDLSLGMKLEEYRILPSGLKIKRNGIKSVCNQD